MATVGAAMVDAGSGGSAIPDVVTAGGAQPQAADSMVAAMMLEAGWTEAQATATPRGLTAAVLAAGGAPPTHAVPVDEQILTPTPSLHPTPTPAPTLTLALTLTLTLTLTLLALALTLTLTLPLTKARRSRTATWRRASHAPSDARPSRTTASIVTACGAPKATGALKAIGALAVVAAVAARFGSSGSARGRRGGGARGDSRRERAGGAASF